MNRTIKRDDSVPEPVAIDCVAIPEHSIDHVQQV